MTFSLLFTLTSLAELFRYTLTTCFSAFTFIAWSSYCAFIAAVYFLLLTRVAPCPLDAPLACSNIQTGCTFWFRVFKVQPRSWPEFSLLQHSLDSFLYLNESSCGRILTRIPHWLNASCVAVLEPPISQKRLLSTFPLIHFLSAKSVISIY